MWQDAPQVHYEASFNEDDLHPPAEAAPPMGSNALQKPPIQIPFLGRAAPQQRIPPMEHSPFHNNAFNPVAGSYITVFSGTLMGRLHLDLFQCPGIHEPCIEFNGEMLTPKEFTYRSFKNKQKDWKGSIRAGQGTLRSIMEAKVIDFYNHKTLCSGKCQGHFRGSFPKIKPRPSVPVYPTTPSQRYTPYPMAVPPLHEPYLPPQDRAVHYPPPTASIVPPAPPLLPQMNYYPPASGDVVHEGQMTYANQEDPNGASSSPPAAPTTVMTYEQLMHISDTEPVMFWNEVRRVALLPDVLQMTLDTVGGLRLSALDPNFDVGNFASTLTRLIEALGLKPFVVSRIQMQQTSQYGTMASGDVGYQAPQENANLNYDQVPNPYGADVAQFFYNPIFGEDGAVASEVTVATAVEYEDTDRPSASPTPMAPCGFVSKHESNDEE